MPIARSLLLLAPLLLHPVADAQGPQPAVPLRTVHLAADHLTLQLPPDWLISRHDRELSTFHQEARTAPPSVRLHFVAALPENPYPASTFSGAHFYISATIHSAANHAAQHAPGARARSPQPAATVGNLPATHTHDEHGTICIQFRDDAYTVRRRHACIRFDLAMNNFCGGEVSGVADLTPAQIDSIRRRLEAVLQSVRFDP